MKSKKKWLGMGALILIVLCMSAAFMATQGKTNYYTQIDNRWVKEIAPHGAMNYKYTLVAYDANGKERDTLDIAVWFAEVFAESTEPEEKQRVMEIVKKLAEYKPLAKIEEMEEQNYNMGARHR